MIFISRKMNQVTFKFEGWDLITDRFLSAWCTFLDSLPYFLQDQLDVLRKIGDILIYILGGCSFGAHCSPVSSMLLVIFDCPLISKTPFSRWEPGTSGRFLLIITEIRFFKQVSWCLLTVDSIFTSVYRQQVLFFRNDHPVTDYAIQENPDN